MDEEAIRALIAEHFGVDPERAVDTARFDSDLGADSLDIVELTMLLESNVGVAIADEEGERCACVGDALRLLREKVAVRSAAPRVVIF